ncbi:MAG: signal recognition particle receptor subunit alpha, partial [Lachnospiraceae bacterium]|nr:signal recognition particle receptor subunit alpha [Lachnospiraceae bacterium]
MKQEVAEKVERELREEEERKLSNRLSAGLAKTRESFIRNIDYVFGGFANIDDEFYEELEEILITGDLGVRTTTEILDNIKETVKRDKISDPKECRQVLIDNIKSIMDLGEISYDFEEKTSVIFVVGVNGVGKTTTIGKLSSKIVLSGKKVVIAAADTFRAA